jgi:Domain of unknown function (DUF4407)
MLTSYFQRFRRFVLALSGAHLQTLDLVPTERARFESLGWAILITSGMAAISMWFALASAVGINGILALPIAVFWGLVIMGIDRWLVNSIPIDENRKWAIALPRVLLAILLGALISTPLVLRIFQSEINAQIAKMQQSNYNTYLKTQKNSQLAAQITTYNTELQYLNTVINSHGASTGSTAADPQLVAYNKQLTSLDHQLATWTALQGKYYQNYICQLYGGPNCPKKGFGPAAATSKQNYDNATSEIATIKGQINHVQQEIQARDTQLNDNSAAAQQNRYQEALTQRPLIQNEYNTAVQQQNQLQQSYYAQNQASRGILVRLEALSQLSDGNFTVAAARFLLFLVFLVIECLPVTVKLLQKPGHYEAALRQARAAESRDVDMFYSAWSGYLGSGAPPAPAPPADPLQADPRKAKPVPAGPGSFSDVFGIWHPTKVMDRVVGDPEDQRGTEVLDDRDRPEFPPSESDPRASRGWRQSPADRPHGNGAEGGQSRGRQGWGDTAEEPGAKYSGPDYGYDYDVPSGDAYREVTSPQSPAHAEEDRSVQVHEALYRVEEEEPASARSDGNGAGIPLNWDDE